MPTVGGAFVSPWHLAYDVDLTSIASGSLGVASGSKSIGGKTWTAVNGGSYLTADPNGLYTSVGTGLCIAPSTTNSTPDITTPSGYVLYITLANLIGTTLWPGSSDDGANHDVWVEAIIDASNANANTEVGYLGVADGSGFARGGSVVAGFISSANAVGWTKHASAYSLSSTAVSPIPTAIALLAKTQSTQSYWGVASGTTFPATWSSTLTSGCGHSKVASGSGVILQRGTVIMLGAASGNTSGNFTMIFKRLRVWIQPRGAYNPYGASAVIV